MIASVRPHLLLGNLNNPLAGGVFLTPECTARIYSATSAPNEFWAKSYWRLKRQHIPTTVFFSKEAHEVINSFYVYTTFIFLSSPASCATNSLVCQ
jgi:hypothetical protein